jgi:predicted ABC-type ATPase
VIERAPAPQIYVSAGTNGGGKSSIFGAMIRDKGADYFNPDEAAHRILAANPTISLSDANSVAWHQGVRLLQRAMHDRLDFAFETTLGGRTITQMLRTAISRGCQVRVWYVALSSPELHIARVKLRVAKGGHPIPDDTIRKRYDQSRTNLIELLPGLAELWVYDNSEDADPAAQVPPIPKRLLHMDRGRIVGMCDPGSSPAWVRPILAAAIKLQ